MSSTTGPTAAITATKLRHRLDTFLTMSSVTKTWMKMATGVHLPAMATSGSPMFPQAGPLIAKATGPGSIPGDGPGLTMSLGAMLPFTMGAGCRLRAVGAGYPDRWKWSQFMRPPWSSSLAEAADSEATWAGFL